MRLPTISCAVVATALIFNFDAAAAPNAFLVHVGLQALADSRMRTVPLEYEFGKGDRFRLTVRPEEDTFLYLYFRRGERAGERLWPTGNGSYLIKAGQEVFIPSNARLRVATESGEDTLQLFFTRAPFKNPDALFSKARFDPIRQIRLRAIELEAQPGTEASPTVFTAELNDRGIAILEIPLRRR